MVYAPRQRDTAAVCRRGHVATSRAETVEYGVRCKFCGSEVITACPACGERIPGMWQRVAAHYSPPDFCERCGEPYPWLSRQGRIYLLQNILDEADVSEAEKLRAREQLDALTDPDLGEEEQAERWARFRKAAPAVWAGEQAQRIIGSIVEVGTRAMIDKYAP